MYVYGDFNIKTILRKITTNKSITYCEKTFQLLSAGNRNAQEIKRKVKFAKSRCYKEYVHRIT